MDSRRFTVAVIALIAVTVLASLVYADLSTGVKAPGFTLPTLNGKSITLASCFAKEPRVVVLDIWATWCPPCRAEIPYLVKLSKKYSDKGLTIVGVALDQRKSDVTAFVKNQKINYTIALDPNAETVGSKYEVKGIPATYVIDKQGVVRYVHSGFPRSPDEGKKEAAKIESEVKTLLAEK